MNVLLTTGSDLLDAEFRQAMEIPLLPAEEQRLRGALQALMAQLLARRDLKYDPKLQSMLLACRLRLRSLQNLLLCERREAPAHCKCELRELTEDLCAAADLLLHPLGRVVRFEAPEEPAEALCAPRDFSWLVLELICNAVRHCHGEEIRVSLDLKRQGRRYRPQACFLTVECKGPLDLERLHAAGAKQGSGVSALLRTAWLHRGAILWLHRDGMSVAAPRLPLDESRGANWYDAPDYVELLSDRCSQVYIALAPVIAMVTP
jgi:hypothetical protein